MLTREELLLLILYTSPSTLRGSAAVIGSTRLQKLVFLSTRESRVLKEICPEPYDFVPYDYGPYSPRLDQDIRHLADIGFVQGKDSESSTKDVEELSFEYLTSHIRKPPNGSDIYVLSGAAVQQVAKTLARLKDEGRDPSLILQEFKNQHLKYDDLSTDDLLKYVYQKYPPMAAKTKRRDLLPESHEEGDEEAEDYDT